MLGVRARFFALTSVLMPPRVLRSRIKALPTLGGMGFLIPTQSIGTRNNSDSLI